MSTIDPRQRMDELGHAMDTYPARVREARDRLAEVSDRQVRGSDPDGLVTVEVTVTGVVTGVHITEAALRDAPDRRLAGCVRAAVNQALERAEQLLAETAGARDDEDETDEHLAAFESRMDAIMADLDRML